MVWAVTSTESPIWKLTQALAGRDGAGAARRALDAVRGQGGPWCACVDWTELDARSATAPTTARWARSWAWLRALFFDATDPPAKPIDLPAVVGECHACLAQQNLTWLARLMSPFWGDLPVEEVTLSQKGIVWAVVTEAVRRHGPSVLPDARHLAPYRFTGGLAGNDQTDDRPDTDETEPQGQVSGIEPLGDLLALHLGIESIGAHIAKSVLRLEPTDDAGPHDEERHEPQVAPSARPEDDPRPRCPGGLRTETFLRTYSALRVRATSSGTARRWLATVDALVDASPLTRLVYLDLVAREAGIAAAQTVDFAKDGAAFLPLVNFVTRARWWHDLWFSHLARSLLAAVRSPTASHEECQAARDRYEAHRQGLIARYGPQHRRVRSDSYLAALWDDVKKLEQAEYDEYLPRLAALAAILGPRDVRSKTALHVRFLDLLVRCLAAQNGPAVSAHYRSLRSPPHKLLHDEARVAVLLSSSSPLAVQLCEMLVGSSLSGLLASLPGVDGSRSEGSARTLAAIKWLTDCLELVLAAEFPVDEAGQPMAEEMAKGAGLPPRQARALLHRFTSDEDAGIEVAFQCDDPRTYAPRTLLRGWRADLVASLSVAMSRTRPDASGESPDA